MQDFKQRLLENGYFRQEELVFADCDRNKRARVATLLSKVGAYAGYDYDARGLTMRSFTPCGRCFCSPGSRCGFITAPWPGTCWTSPPGKTAPGGAHMQRVFEMADQTGRLCVSVKSEWILVDPLTRKILRPASFTAKPLMTCDRVIDCPDPQKITLPRQGLEELGERQVRWSDLDGNGHLFSGRYGDIVWDYLPADLQALPGEGVPDQLQPGGHPGRESAPAGHPGCARLPHRGLGPGRLSCFTAQCVFGEAWD